MGEVVFLAIVLIVLIAVRVPMAYALGISGALYLIVTPYSIHPPALLDQMVRGIHSYSFLAVPFFILAGRLFNASGITNRIFDFAMSLVGHIKGGMGHVNIVASVIFSGMSGAAVADTAGLGLIEIQAMKRDGYKASFAACITAASATIGPIIPPSVTLIIYGVLAGASIGRLFIAGIVPGLLLALALMVTVYIMALRNPASMPTRRRATPAVMLKSFKGALLPLFAPVIILGGILFGITTPTEAGVVAVIYAVLLGLVYREFKLEGLGDVFIKTVTQVGAVMLILAGARVFSYVMTIERVPALMTEAVLGFTESPIVLLLILNVLLLILGMFMNSSTILVLTVPILVPLLQDFGIDLVHFGQVITLNVMIGMLTPPLGVTLYIASGIAEVPFQQTLRDIIPFYIPLVVVLLLITLIPDIVLWLPNLMMG